MSFTSEDPEITSVVATELRLMEAPLSPGNAAGIGQRSSMTACL
ncbi:hypothetical protein [Nocardia sp. NPDC057668]